VHQSVDLFLRALEVVDGKCEHRDEFDVKDRTYFQNLVVRELSFFYVLFFAKQCSRGTCGTYPPQCDEAVDVPLYYLHTLDTGIPSISIHDEGNMPWYRTCSKHGEEGTPDAVYDFVTEPVYRRQERHGGHGNGRVSCSLTQLSWRWQRTSESVRFLVSSYYILPPSAGWLGGTTSNIVNM